MKKYKKITSLCMLTLTLSTTYSTGAFADNMLQPEDVSQALPETPRKLLTQEEGQLSWDLSTLKFYNGEFSSWQENVLCHRIPLTPDLKDGLYLDYSDLEHKETGLSSAGGAEFDNTSSVSQTYRTPENVVKHHVSATSETTHTVDFLDKLTAKGSIPGLGSAEGEIRLEYKFNSDQKQSSSDTVSWKVPSQKIKVPAGHKYKVEWTLSDMAVTGKYHLSSKISGLLPYGYTSKDSNYPETLPVGEALMNELNLEKFYHHTGDVWNGRPGSKVVMDWSNSSWEVLNNNEVKRVWADGNIKVVYGTNLKLKVTDVTDCKPKLVQSTKMNIQPEIEQ
ncbi:ETX/MTX2 family pore-forming toxin [Lactococcus garvieae]|uniref:ETX/MTX2 family pore-forming toxin n=1 Tax=Lactococcus garvieae TaxID=1363 RepID=UPI003854A3BB